MEQIDPTASVPPPASLPGRAGRGSRLPRSWRALLLVLAIGGAVAWASIRWQQSFSPRLHWETDSDKALESAQRTRRPVMMVFTSRNCVYCTRLKNRVLEKPEFEAAAGGRVVLAMLDIDEAKHLRLFQAFGGWGTPTVLMTNPQGQRIGQYEGSGSLTTWLTAMLAAYGKVHPATQESRLDAPER